MNALSLSKASRSVLLVTSTPSTRSAPLDLATADDASSLSAVIENLWNSNFQSTAKRLGLAVSSRAFPELESAKLSRLLYPVDQSDSIESRQYDLSS
jgi:hypothetical protein